ncbi:Protein of unknown function (DUF2892) [Gelidibacter algens]|uniref:Inner membrane protein YgaP-like transmembrane domain-containing protein n=1 Tax=Gelidibacter algens TaxID=49280 RepID=A0A1A7R5U4_9FLAO|nr:DUF2892 domain-containing protein [Gelidibacter algens]OBX27236.1 hypothetical protein A9996_00485 [Gelidibacter algens]RAJ22098.1 Protein of unknown function (DUF2892) [Gelidibacter algens]
MKTNMGKSDRMIRLLIAAVIVILYIANIISGTLGIILLVVAGIFILTSVVSFCPLYALLGMNTCKTSQKWND